MKPHHYTQDKILDWGIQVGRLIDDTDKFNDAYGNSLYKLNLSTRNMRARFNEGVSIGSRMAGHEEDSLIFLKLAAKQFGTDHYPARLQEAV